MKQSTPIGQEAPKKTLDDRFLDIRKRSERCQLFGRMIAIRDLFHPLLPIKSQKLTYNNFQIIYKKDELVEKMFVSGWCHPFRPEDKGCAYEVRLAAFDKNHESKIDLHSLLNAVFQAGVDHGNPGKKV